MPAPPRRAAPPRPPAPPRPAAGAPTRPTETIILGIDPGTTVLGFGVVRCRGKEVEMLEVGVLRLALIPDHALKLKRIYDKCASLIAVHAPDHLAIEAPFFGKNVQSMLKLGRAQGVAMAAALAHDVPISEYAPRRVKQAITGSGAASKEQVAAMVARTLGLPLHDLPKEFDATDGLAVALCHHFAASSPKMQAGQGGWKSFLEQNPGRITAPRRPSAR